MSTDMKRVLSLVLSAVLVFGLLPPPVHAHATGLCEHIIDHGTGCPSLEGGDCTCLCGICLEAATPAPSSEPEVTDPPQPQYTAEDCECGSLCGETRDADCNWCSSGDVDCAYVEPDPVYTAEDCECSSVCGETKDADCNWCNSGDVACAYVEPDPVYTAENCNCSSLCVETRDTNCEWCNSGDVVCNFKEETQPQKSQTVVELEATIALLMEDYNKVDRNNQDSIDAYEGRINAAYADMLALSGEDRAVLDADLAYFLEENWKTYQETPAVDHNCGIHTGSSITWVPIESALNAEGDITEGGYYYLTKETTVRKIALDTVICLDGKKLNIEHYVEQAGNVGLHVIMLNRVTICSCNGKGIITTDTSGWIGHGVVFENVSLNEERFTVLGTSEFKDVTFNKGLSVQLASDATVTFSGNIQTPGTEIIISNANSTICFEDLSPDSDIQFTYRYTPEDGAKLFHPATEQILDIVDVTFPDNNSPNMYFSNGAIYYGTAPSAMYTLELGTLKATIDGIPNQTGTVQVAAGKTVVVNNVAANEQILVNGSSSSVTDRTTFTIAGNADVTKTHYCTIIAPVGDSTNDINAEWQCYNTNNEGSQFGTYFYLEEDYSEGITIDGKSPNEDFDHNMYFCLNGHSLNNSCFSVESETNFHLVDCAAAKGSVKIIVLQDPTSGLSVDEGINVKYLCLNASVTHAGVEGATTLYQLVVPEVYQSQVKAVGRYTGGEHVQIGSDIYASAGTTVLLSSTDSNKVLKSITYMYPDGTTKTAKADNQNRVPVVMSKNGTYATITNIEFDDTHTCRGRTHVPLDPTFSIEEGSFYLTDDYAKKSTIYVYDTVYLCLNGHSLDTVLDIRMYDTLHLYDCKGTGKVETIVLDSKATLNYISGNVTNVLLEAGANKPNVPSTTNLLYRISYGDYYKFIDSVAGDADKIVEHYSAYYAKEDTAVTVQPVDGYTISEITYATSDGTATTVTGNVIPNMPGEPITITNMVLTADENLTKGLVTTIYIPAETTNIFFFMKNINPNAEDEWVFPSTATQNAKAMGCTLGVNLFDRPTLLGNAANQYDLDECSLKHAISNRTIDEDYGLPSFVYDDGSSVVGYAEPYKYNSAENPFVIEGYVTVTSGSTTNTHPFELTFIPVSSYGITLPEDLTPIGDGVTKDETSGEYTILERSEVTIQGVPDDKQIVVTTESGETVTVTNGDTFTMPGEAVTVTLIERPYTFTLPHGLSATVNGETVYGPTVEAAKGSTVEILGLGNTVQIKLTDGAGNTVLATGDHTFTMPEKNVTITLTHACHFHEGETNWTPLTGDTITAGGNYFLMETTAVEDINANGAKVILCLAGSRLLLSKSSTTLNNVTICDCTTQGTVEDLRDSANTNLPLGSNNTLQNLNFTDLSLMIGGSGNKLQDVTLETASTITYYSTDTGVTFSGNIQTTGSANIRIQYAGGFPATHLTGLSSESRINFILFAGSSGFKANTKLFDNVANANIQNCLTTDVEASKLIYRDNHAIYYDPHICGIHGDVYDWTPDGSLSETSSNIFLTASTETVHTRFGNSVRNGIFCLNGFNHGGINATGEVTGSFEVCNCGDNAATMGILKVDQAQVVLNGGTKGLTVTEIAGKVTGTGSLTLKGIVNISKFTPNPDNPIDVADMTGGKITVNVTDAIKTALADTTTYPYGVPITGGNANADYFETNTTDYEIVSKDGTLYLRVAPQTISLPTGLKVSVNGGEPETVTSGTTIKAYQGDTIGITELPRNTALVVKDANNTTVTVNGDNTFTMPATAVTVSLTHKCGIHTGITDWVTGTALTQTSSNVFLTDSESTGSNVSNTINGIFCLNGYDGVGLFVSLFNDNSFTGTVEICNCALSINSNIGRLTGSNAQLVINGSSGGITISESVMKVSTTGSLTVKGKVIFTLQPDNPISAADMTAGQITVQVPDSLKDGTVAEVQITKDNANAALFATDNADYKVVSKDNKLILRSAIHEIDLPEGMTVKIGNETYTSENNPVKVKEGETVDVTSVTETSGEKIVVKDANGDPVDTKDFNTFTMPDSPVTISVTHNCGIHPNVTDWKTPDMIFGSMPGISASGYYYLDKDYASFLGYQSGNVILCLNGHTISSYSSSSTYGDVTICNCKAIGSIETLDVGNHSNTYTIDGGTNGITVGTIKTGGTGVQLKGKVDVGLLLNNAAKTGTENGTIDMSGITTGSTIRLIPNQTTLDANLPSDSEVWTALHLPEDLNEDSGITFDASALEETGEGYIVIVDYENHVVTVQQKPKYTVTIPTTINIDAATDVGTNNIVFTGKAGMKFTVSVDSTTLRENQFALNHTTETDAYILYSLQINGDEQLLTAPGVLTNGLTLDGTEVNVPLVATILRGADGLRAGNFSHYGSYAGTLNFDIVPVETTTP